MTDVSSNNINAHYTVQTKVERPVYTVASAPGDLPKYHTFDDNDANKKFVTVNKDIYTGTRDEKSKPARKFWTIYLSFAAAVLAIIGAKKLFK